MTNLSRARGFSLLEVLVAFAFLALVGTALYRVFSGALQNAAAAEEHSRAVLIGESRLAGLGMGKVLSAGTESGEVEGDKFRWTIEIRPYIAPPSEIAPPPSASSAPAPNLGAKLIEAQVTVIWPGPRGTSQQLTLTTLRLAPGE
ncbi:MAG: prepilin-type N-terminal cleavage/methylation domain-containing protein [Betaproteobacteria bacterium]|nr:prepilin-type N-terminal cleavage/methylation domain-containing protein [Betaproteobacteria bacterium]